MAFKSISISLTVLSFAISTAANAAVITHGNLTTDSATNYITDTTTGRQYMRFDESSLTYAETITAVSAGGIFEEWTIADSTVADDFYSAMLGVSSTPCTGANFEVLCGYVSGWTQSDFGASGVNSIEESFFYLSSNDTPDKAEALIGIGIWRTSDGRLHDVDDWNGIAQADYTGSIGDGVSYLLYTDAAVVPVPAAAWLFGSGLLGLVGVARRKKA